jgi:hypothetical protein
MDEGISKVLLQLVWISKFFWRPLPLFCNLVDIIVMRCHWCYLCD